MKLIILLFVFLGFAALGWFIRAHFRARKVFFDNLLAFCEHLLTEINFSKNSVIQVIDTYAQSYAKPFREVLFGYKNLLTGKHDITRARTDAVLFRKLKTNERTPIADFFFELGRHGATEETEKIHNKRIIFREFHAAAAQTLTRDASIYFKICILLGIAAVILLL